MRKIIVLSVVILFVFAACQNKSGNYKISGEIAGVDSGKVYLLKPEVGKAPIVEDTADIVNGNFEMEGTAGKYATFHLLRLNKKQYFAEFFLQGGKTNITAYKDSTINATKISGSSETDIFNIFIKELASLQQKRNKYKQEYQAAAAKQNQQEMDRIQADFQASSDNMIVYTKNFIRENNNSVVAPFILYNQLAPSLEYDQLKELTDTISPELQGSEYMSKLNEYLSRKAKTAIGAIASDFTMKDTEGNDFTLSSLRGKYVLIDFWASWCSPCRKENPNVVTAYNNFKDKGFDIVGVSLDKDKKAWVKAIKDDNLTWHHVSDLKFWNNVVARTYGVQSIPYNLLLDKEGKIIAMNLRGENLSKKLKEIMPE
ncbi:MAG: AhpC/TSA family protein [Prolixibacteraceae bacterium]|nr:AhpC/TSA family protein [Prolixibacteraceae bacterium]